MKALLYNHRNGDRVIPSERITEVIDSLALTETVVARYAISTFRDAFLSEIKERGWSDEIDLDIRSNISITSEKLGTGLCLQTGNVSRTYADMLKLQALFIQGNISAGIIIVPTKDCAQNYCLSNSATYERLRRELEIFNQVITLPIVLIGFYN